MTADAELIELSLAAHDAAISANFYDKLLGAGLEPFQAYGATFYRGNLHGVRFVIAPNGLAGVDAAQNRHQFVYRTANLNALLERAEEAGGSVRDRSETAATVLDPDGNTIVFQTG